MESSAEIGRVEPNNGRPESEQRKSLTVVREVVSHMGNNISRVDGGCMFTLPRMIGRHVATRFYAYTAALKRLQKFEREVR